MAFACAFAMRATAAASGRAAAPDGGGGFGEDAALLDAAGAGDCDGVVCGAAAGGEVVGVAGAEDGDAGAAVPRFRGWVAGDGAERTCRTPRWRIRVAPASGIGAAPVVVGATVNARPSTSNTRASCGSVIATERSKRAYVLRDISARAATSRCVQPSRNRCWRTLPTTIESNESFIEAGVS